MISIDSHAVNTRDVEVCYLGRCQLALGFHHNLQHLGIGLTYQHLADADVLGGNASNSNVALLVTLGLYIEVGLNVTAFTYVLDGYRTIDDNGGKGL